VLLLLLRGVPPILVAGKENSTYRPTHIIPSLTSYLLYAYVLPDRAVYHGLCMEIRIATAEPPSFRTNSADDRCLSDFRGSVAKEASK